MSAPYLVDADEADCNWISELQRAKGRIPTVAGSGPTFDPSALERPMSVMAYSPGQSRDQKGRFGSGGGGGGRVSDGSVHEETGVGDEGGQLDVANDLDDFNEEGQKAILGRINAIADVTPGFPRTPEEMADGLETILDQATDAQVRVGMTWYQDAHEEFAARGLDAGMTTAQAHAVVAVCSPLREWDNGHGNAEVARRIIQIHKDGDKPFTVTQADIDAKVARDPQHRPIDFKPGTYKAKDLTGYQLALVHPALQGFGTVGGAKQVDRAFKIARGEVTVDTGTGGTKVRNFYNNLHDPSDSKSVTVDTWQVRAMAAPFTKRLPLGKLPPKEGKEIEWQPVRGDGAVSVQWATGSPTSVKGKVADGVGVYPFFADAIQIVAKRRNLKPHQVQAIAWTVFRDQETGNVTT